MADTHGTFDTTKFWAKSAFNGTLRLLGYDRELAAILGIKIVRQSDLFIVSYPKSGNTWIRFLLANLLQSEQAVTFHDLDTYVPDLHKCRSQIDGLRAPRFIKTHYAYCERYPKFLYVCRDGRDAMVSFYHFQKQLGRFSGDFSEFIRSRKTNVFGQWLWHEHVDAALRERERRPKSVLFVRYEDLLENPLEITGSIARFCGLETTEQQIERVVERCSFEQLKKVEQRYGGAGNLESFMRSGTKNQWPDYFNDTDLEYFHEKAGGVLERLGYLTQGGHQGVCEDVPA